MCNGAVLHKVRPYTMPPPIAEPSITMSLALRRSPRPDVIVFPAEPPVCCRVLPRVRPKTVDIAIRLGGLTQGKTLQQRAIPTGDSNGRFHLAFPSSLQINHVLHYLVDVIVVMRIDVVLVPSLGIVNDILRYIIMGALVADDMVEITLLP